jgi:mannosylglycerate hydrolase
MGNNNKSVFHIISNTHWDREWRFPFQRNRQMLVDMIDAVLEILESEPDYRAFHLDSQSIVLKDYLEIKPQNKERIIKLTKENRLLHGPWYILPEEFQVGGENLVRNLLIGHKVSNKYGGASKIGYSPFSWGQISQLPQLYKEFNINLIMFYRGINSIDSPKAEFLWEGADGTQMISSRFSTMPRYNFYFYIYRPAVHNEGFYDVEYKWNKGGTPFHFADKMQHNEDYFIISPHQEYYPENIQPMVEKIIQDQADDFTSAHKIWMEGHDSSGPNRLTVNIIRDIKKKMPHLYVRHSTLEEYAALLAENLDVENLKKVFDERRSAQNNNRCGNLFGYTTSARMYLKQANFDAERWLQYYAEPFNIFSAMNGRDINDQYTETAWELIVQNSAHDSIGGCSLDPIHEDMMIRYRHAVEISKGVFERSAKHLVNTLNTSALEQLDESGIFITVVNPANYLRSDVTEAFIDIPKTLDKGDFDLLDSNGKLVEKALIARESHQPVLEQMINRPMFFDMIRYHVYLHLNEIPSFGLKTFVVRPVEPSISSGETTDCKLENEYFSINVQPDGSLDIFDKQTESGYEGVAFFEDHGEAGHAWVLNPVGPFISTKNSKASIRKRFSSSIYNEISIEHKLMLPANLKSRSEINEPFVENRIELIVGLSKGQKHISLLVNVENNSESHRLRLMIPTKLNAEFSFGEGQFNVVKRSLKRIDSTGWLEQPMYDYPMHHFVDVSNGQKGFAVLTDGLKEYEVLDNEEQTLAITLLRTFEYKINPSAPQDYSHEKGSQMQGKSQYRLALCPHKGDWQEGGLYEEAHLFNYPLRLLQTGKLRGAFGTERSLLKVLPDGLVFSAFKKAENDESNASVLRLFNPTDETIQGKISLETSIISVQKVSLEEIPSEEIPLADDHSFEITAAPKKIVSYLIRY